MKRLLIIEDDRWLADVYRDILQRDFDVSICFEAQSAIETLENAIPDLILLDIMLPGANGLAFLQELRSYDDAAATPVILCSSAGLSEDHQRAIAEFAPVRVIDKSDITPTRLKTETKNAAKH